MKTVFITGIILQVLTAIAYSWLFYRERSKNIELLKQNRVFRERVDFYRLQNRSLRKDIEQYVKKYGNLKPKKTKSISIKIDWERVIYDCLKSLGYNVPEPKSLKTLEEQLKEAIEREDYEEAQRIQVLINKKK